MSSVVIIVYLKYFSFKTDLCCCYLTSNICLTLIVVGSHRWGGWLTLLIGFESIVYCTNIGYSFKNELRSLKTWYATTAAIRKLSFTINILI